MVRSGHAPSVVSIVLPTYNGERYLAEAIDSCLAQSYPHLELLVVDDGSTVDVRSLVERTQDARVRYLRHPENRGLSTALNTGFASARGDYFTWTSDDNRYRPQAIERMRSHLEAHPELGLVYAGCRLIDERGTPGEIVLPPPPESLWIGNCVGACFLYRRQVLEQVGEYDPAVPLVEDYDYWVRTARLFRLERLEETLYEFRVHPSSLTRTLSLNRKRESHLKVLAKMQNGAVGAPVPSDLLRVARAAMHAAYGRDYFFAGQSGPARRDLWAALRLQPSNLAHWGIVGPLLKSLAGDNLLHHVRAVRRGQNPSPRPSGSLRILHCCGQFAATQGGTERQARAVCVALAARGHQVSVLARKMLIPDQAAPGVTIHRRIRAIDRGRLFGLTYLCSAIAGLLCRVRRTDLLHAHHLYLDAIAALVVGRMSGQPIVAKMVGAGPGGDLDRLRHTSGGSLFLRLLYGLDAVIAPSPTCRRELLEAGFPADRIHVIANGVDISKFRPGPSLEPAKPLWPGEEVGVVFSGRLIEAKGVLVLVDAWPSLLREVPGAHLVLVGSGPLEAELRRRAVLPHLAGRMHLTGEVSDVRPYLRAATAFVFPSLAEGLPNALLEAMAMGLPCVATDIGPITEAAINGEEALLVSVNSPQSLAAALAKILTQPALATRLGHAARKRVEAEFSLEREVDALEVLYRELTSRCGQEARHG